MNKLNQIPHISQQKPQNKRLRIYKPQEGMVKRTPIEVAESLLKASEPAQRMALTTFPIICRHGLAKISRDKLGQHTGYCSKTMGYAGDELHKIGFLWKINQEFIDGNFTSCEYEVLGPCFSAEVIEVLFTIAKELKILSYFMLFTFKEVLKYIVRNGNFPLLSSLYIYIS